MSVTQVFVATVYAFFNLQPVFVLLVFIFVGAIGIVTVALAATYRTEPERQVSGFWVLPVFLTVLIIGSAIMSNIIFAPQPITPGIIAFELMDFIPVAEYLLIVVALISLVVLLLLSVLKMGVGGRS